MSTTVDTSNMGYQPTARRVTLKEFLAVAKAAKWSRDFAKYALDTTVALGGGTMKVGKTWYRIIDLPRKDCGA